MQRRSKTVGSSSVGRVPLVVTVCAVLALLLTSSAVRATPFDLRGTDWEGCSDLVRLAETELGPERVTTTDHVDFKSLRPEDGLLLLHPERSLDVDELARFMRRGGRVVLLDDFGRGDALLKHFGMQRVPMPRNPPSALRNNPQLALAEAASAHPVVSEVNRVVTNHATGIAHPDLSPVLLVRGGEGESDVVVAVAGAVGDKPPAPQGRFLVVGDPSIVMNAMLRYSGNRAFARGVVRYAVEGDAWSSRGGRLVLAAGAFKQSGARGGPGERAAEALRAMSDGLDGVRKDGMPDALLWSATIALGLALVVWIGSRAGKVHKPTAPRFVRATPTALQGGVAGHAAVIGAAETSRVLAALELKSALEEQIALLLGRSKVPPQGELLALVAESGLLDADGVRSLSGLLLRMSNVETMVVYQHTGKIVQPIRDEEVLAMGDAVRRILDRARSAAAARAAGTVGP